MSALRIDPTGSPEELYGGLYNGDLALFTGLPSVAELVEFARDELQSVFAPHDPEGAHRQLSPEEMARLLARWKPHFIHHERSRELVGRIVEEAGLPADETLFDVPRPRTAFPVGHLTTGIAFAFPWHRDAWYGAPRQQINWWLPIFDLRADNAMKFDLASFARSVPNDSGAFDYYRANRDRLTTARQVKRETQVRPRAIGHEAGDELVVLLRPGSVLLFSAAHLHASIANTSEVARYSIDFRTVHGPHVAERIGAPFVDVECTGTAIRDFASVATGERLDEELVRSVYGAPPEDAMVVFDRDAAERAVRDVA